MDFRVKGARQIFPCWDTPALKAIFKISVRHPKNFSVLSNMRMLSRDLQEDHTWTHLDIKRPISPHCITLSMQHRDFVGERLSIRNVHMYYGKYTNVGDMQFAQLVAHYVTNNLMDTMKWLFSWKSVNLLNLLFAIRPKVVLHR